MLRRLIYRMRYNPPPNWPQPPAGWTPPPGWQPDPAWGPAPHGWKLFVDDRNWFARHKVLTAVAAVLALFIIAGVASGGGDSDVTTTPAADAHTQPAEAATDDSAVDADNDSDAATSEKDKATSDSKPGIGDKARDGKFEFTVLGLDCGKKQIGDQYLNQKAQGQFCLLGLKVRNIGDESRTFDGSNQLLYDVKDRKFEADTEAGIYLDDSKSFLEEINPGNVVKGVVVFDVPKNFAPEKAELHDSLFSGGVEVSLH
jgi:hypothetical protein